MKPVKPAILAFAAAALAGASFAAAPALARSSSSVSFGVSIGSGGYYAPYRVYRGPAYYPRSHRSYYGSRASRYYAPPPAFYGYAAPPVVTYETVTRYDPMPRWRNIAPAPAASYGYQPYPQDYGYDPYGAYEAAPYQDPYQAQYQEPHQDPYQAPYPARQDGYYQAQSPVQSPAMRGDLVRFDLAQQGYTASDLAQSAPIQIQPYRSQSAGYQTYGGADYVPSPPVRFDQFGGGAADSYVRPYNDADDLLLGGPQ